MSLRMAFFEDLIQSHLSFGKHGIIVGHALSENTSQFREREREKHGQANVDEWSMYGMYESAYVAHMWGPLGSILALFCFCVQYFLALKSRRCGSCC